MVEEKASTTFDHLMNFMTAYVQHNQVSPQDLPTVFEQVKDVVFDISDATPDEGVAPRRSPAPVQSADAVRGSGNATASENEDTQPSRPRKEVASQSGEQEEFEQDEFEEDEKEQPDSPPPYKFANISRIPFGGMDPEDAIKPDSIINLIDGVEQTFLRRALKTKYDMTPEEYRAHFGLRPDYPVVAPNYSAKRKKIMNNTLRKMGRNVAEDEAPPRRHGRPAKTVSSQAENEAKVVKRTRQSDDDFYDSENEE